MEKSEVLLFIFWICFLSERALANIDLCRNDSFTSCAPENTFPLNFPENQNELDTSCVIVSELMTCVRQYEILCHGSFPYEDDFQRVFGTLQRVCDKNSALYAALVKNLKCIKIKLDDHNSTCFEDQQAVLNAIEMYINMENSTENEDTSMENLEIMFCLLHAYNIGCFLKQLEKCGTEATDLITEVIKSSGFILDGCPSDNRPTFLMALHKLELDNRQKQLIKDVFLIIDENK